MDLESRNVKYVYENISNKFSGTRQNTWDWVDSFLDDFDSNSKICDLGCGNGRNMTKKNLNFVGVDNCSNFIKICKENGQNVIESDMVNINIESNIFDGLISIASFHHLSTIIRRKRCLSEISRILKKNGRCLLSVWSKNQPAKSKRSFDFGDNFVGFIDNGSEYKRYYYIFNHKELRKLLEINFKILDHKWIFGNEIYYLENNK